jgi:peptide-methionine (S)-S-oxide reductase
MFWYTEAFFELDGVTKVVSGYIGGKTVNPTYKEICNGDTGHAEAIEITFDPKKITFGELLEIFLPHMIQLL